jgi:hypothetical protein
VVPTSGVARLLHQAYARTWWRFSASSHSDDFHWTWKPMDLVNVTSAATAHASAYSVIQKVERNLLTGVVTLTTGTPTHRGISDISALKQTFTRASEEAGESSSGTAGTQTYGMKDKPRPDLSTTTIAPTVTVGTTTTLSPGASATVTDGDAGPNVTLNFGIPAGATGAAGATPTFSIGTVTGTSGSAAVTLTGTPPAYVLNFTLHDGADGTNGYGVPTIPAEDEGHVYALTWISGVWQWIDITDVVFP